MSAWAVLQALYELVEAGRFEGEDGDLEEMECLYFRIFDEEDEPELFRFSGRQKEDIKGWAEKNGLEFDEA